MQRKIPSELLVLVKDSDLRYYLESRLEFAT